MWSLWFAFLSEHRVRLGIPAVEYKNLFDPVLLIARYLYVAMMCPAYTSIVENLRSRYE